MTQERERWQPCYTDPLGVPCRGWFVTTGTGYKTPDQPCIQRCDACNRFASDEHAAAHAYALMIDGDKDAAEQFIELAQLLEEYHE